MRRRCRRSARGRVVHDAYTRQLGEHIRGQIADSEARCSAAERRRLDAFIDTTLRVRRRYRQEPTEYYYPGLPAIEFYERGEFPWLPEFESATAAIGQELVDILREDGSGIHALHPLRPSTCRSTSGAGSIIPRAGAPTTSTIMQSRSRIAAGSAPATIAAVSRVPQAAVALRSPCAMYSALSPEDADSAAYRRRELPSGRASAAGRARRAAGSASAARSREWRVGEAWVFDDTIEHEAWNDSDDPRYILICDVWSPRLSPEERTAIAGIIAATDAFNGTVPAAHV